MKKQDEIEFKLVVVAIIVIALVMMTTGCSTIQRAVGYGAEVNDGALEASEFTICNAASVGSIKRRYNTEDKAEAWAELCKAGSATLPIIKAIAGGGE